MIIVDDRNERDLLSCCCAGQRIEAVCFFALLLSYVHIYSQVFYDMMSVVTDLDQKQTARGARHPMFAKLLLIFYAIVAVILLMNMLIAMMNTSYETVRVTRCNLWRQQQLSILLLIERRFFWLRRLCEKSERDIWRKLDSSSAEERCYLDVTMLHTPSYKCV